MPSGRCGGFELTEAIAQPYEAVVVAYCSDVFDLPLTAMDEASSLIVFEE